MKTNTCAEISILDRDICNSRACEVLLWLFRMCVFFFTPLSIHTIRKGI